LEIHAHSTFLYDAEVTALWENVIAVRQPSKILKQRVKQEIAVCNFWRLPNIYSQNQARGGRTFLALDDAVSRLQVADALGDAARRRGDAGRGRQSDGEPARRLAAPVPARPVHGQPDALDAAGAQAADDRRRGGGTEAQRARTCRQRVADTDDEARRRTVNVVVARC